MNNIAKIEKQYAEMQSYGQCDPLVRLIGGDAVNWIQFTVPGRPKGKGRPRFSRYSVYTPHGTMDYERKIKEAYRAAGGPLFTGDIAVRVQAFFGIPKSWKKEKRERAVKGYLYPGRPSPDIDNIMKIVLDALNGIAYKDDDAVVYALCSKAYVPPGQEARLEVTLLEGKKRKE